MFGDLCPEIQSLQSVVLSQKTYFLEMYQFEQQIVPSKYSIYWKLKVYELSIVLPLNLGEHN